MERPGCSISVDEHADGYLPLKDAATYLGLKPRMLRNILPPQLRFRVSSKKILVKRSELDQFMEQYRELPQTDLDRIVWPLKSRQESPPGGFFVYALQKNKRCVSLCCTHPTD